ncbi:hypothetical protein [Leptospira borgpetersenii]|uniref:Uncharacterized protein n=1 Tax=Leptospira borgpetersenii serovar Hardjo-bovis str. Sponselee TaxID=1303729 RepID=M6C4F8_LEPBO|nr:hypothetical protein [Leptospira borgpetersenii]EMJ83673.1 hypothetical protein LEP1GSC016_3058 [Leptospira borgpetersenii serovar Hardjo-bovis str. Sponselee]MBE8360615.1 hypothetical protein [Leptospira borgpetersenii serovar Hardjo-bovis]MBE8363060.1 hypothetical protein [Leptospira borgpetersenii serovar Balcanica]MBE8366439.1 hypothetical protein [Leptospira borgpetersenii serovar Balcanica]MBE8371402.1 hypothetical protein [Leptospira borgpetersenii serovar Hardjo-bovis]
MGFLFTKFPKNRCFSVAKHVLPNCPPNVGVATEIAVLAVFSYRLKL